MISITDKTACCGCNACGDICPHGAISFITDNEGFWYPKVDASRCTGCGLCEHVCPIINISQLKKNDLPQSICFAAEHKNLEVVFDSTSGGLFSALAEIVYKAGGYVGGAIYNDDFSVSHFISNEKTDLPRLRSSKYLQSHLDGFFKQVKDLLDKGATVLICGTPCQMAAMRSYLGKDYENLFIVDFVCRGVNSPKVWRKYLDTFEERYGSKVVYCKSKSKEFGWRNLTLKVVLENGKHCYETKDQNDFTKGYLQTGVFCRPSCYDCKFKGYPRIADITLADFWGIENVDQFMEKDLGTSLVMINSKKGEVLFNDAQKKLNYIPVSFNKAEEGNPALNKSLAAPRVNREQFFADLDNMSFTQIAKKYIAKGGMSFHGKVKAILKLLYRVLNLTQCNPKALCQFFRFNSVNDIAHGNILVPTPHCIISISKHAHVIKRGLTILGNKIKFKESRIETRLFVGENATLDLGGGTVIGYGSDIEVFKDATLVFGGDCGSNIGLTIVCGEQITIGRHTIMGRNVTIRDSNGDHYLNRPGYRTTRPVIIGEKAWLCEQCTIMPGVKIGDGAIIGACSFVSSHVPAHTLVSGNPAQIADEDILWKY